MPLTDSSRSVVNPKLTLVVPCHNEAQVLPEITKRLCALLDELTQKALIADSAIFFVDDGSVDDTWISIESLSIEQPRIHGIKLSRNFGQQNAILAGLLEAPGDMLISIDADLQDDVTAIEEMVRAFARGARSYTAFGVAARPIAFSNASRPKAFTGCYRQWAWNSCSTTLIFGY